MHVKSDQTEARVQWQQLFTCGTCCHRSPASPALSRSAWMFPGPSCPPACPPASPALSAQLRRDPGTGTSHAHCMHSSLACSFVRRGATMSDPMQDPHQHALLESCEASAPAAGAVCTWEDTTISTWCSCLSYLSGFLFLCWHVYGQHVTVDIHLHVQQSLRSRWSRRLPNC